MKRVICLFLLLLLFSPKSILAASLVLSSDTISLSQDSELPVAVTLSINTSDNTDYFLRGVFFHEGTSDYCGITWNGSNWFAGPYSTNEGWKNFLKASVQGASWSGVLKAKIDPSDSGCRESGTYKFKIQRFTQSRSGTFDSQNELTISVSVPTSVPSPTPTSKPTPTNKPTSVSKSTLGSSSVKVTSTSTPSPRSLTPTLIMMSQATKTNMNKSVLAVEVHPTLGDGKEVLVKSESGGGFPIWIVPTVLGLGILASTCGILLYREYKKRRETETI